MFCGDREQLTNSQAVKFVGKRLLLFRINLINRQKQWLAGFEQQPRQFQIRRCEFRPSIHNHDNCRCFLQRNSRLTKNLRRNEILFIRDDPPGINQA